MFTATHEAEALRSYVHALVIQHAVSVTPLGLCLRVIVNEKPLYLEMASSSALSVMLLIYGLQYLRSLNK